MDSNIPVPTNVPRTAMPTMGAPYNPQMVPMGNMPIMGMPPNMGMPNIAIAGRNPLLNYFPNPIEANQKAN